MSLFLIMLGAGFFFSLTSRFGVSLSRTQSASFFLPPIATFANALGIRRACAAVRAPMPLVFAGHSGSVETVGLS